MRKNMLDASVTLDIVGQIALKRNVHLVLILWEETETPKGAIVLDGDFVIMALDFVTVSRDTLETDVNFKPSSSKEVRLFARTDAFILKNTAYLQWNYFLTSNHRYRHHLRKEPISTLYHRKQV
eukprot:45277_1